MRWLVAITVVCASLPGCGRAPSPPPADDTHAREIENLKQALAGLQADRDKLSAENASLRKEFEGLRSATEDSAREVLELRQALRKGDRPVDPATPPAPAAETKTIVTARVWAVNPEYCFIIINKGESDGVRPDLLFDVLRDGKKLATAQFAKFVGPSNAQSKLTVIDGKTFDLKCEDVAIGYPKVDAPAPEPKAPRTTIAGRVAVSEDGRGIVIEVGYRNGVKPDMKFEVRRKGRKIGVIVVKKPDEWTSQAQPEGELQRREVQVDDFVESID